MEINARIESRFGTREGRGFSGEELKKAGITPAVARKLGLRLDARRSTVYDPNVAELKKLELPSKKPKKAAPKKKAMASASAAKIKAIEEEKERKIQEAMANAKAEKKPAAKPKKKPAKKAAPKKK